MSKQKQGTKVLTEITQLVEGLHILLEECGVNNTSNAVQVVKTLRGNVEELHKQNQEILQALGCDNWRNAVKKAQSLTKKCDSQIDPPTHGIPLVGGG